MDTIGEVKCVQDGIKDPRKSYEYEWKIFRFSSLSDEADVSYDSPSFLFMGESFFLKMVPNGHRNIPSVGYIALYLYHQKKNSFRCFLTNLEFSLGLKTFIGRKWVEHHCVYSFPEECPGYGRYKIYSRSDIFSKKEHFKPSTYITVFWSFKCPDLTESVGDNTDWKCFSCEGILNAEFISLHKKCIQRSLKCSDCSEVILFQNWLHGHECEKKSAEDDESLCEDFKKMLQDGINHDLILKVGDKEIRAHRDVLRARSHVFKSMLEHDMKEKNRGIIDVSDCDPQAMEVFLSYVYCGKVDALDGNNMLQHADKYQMIGLKNECCSFIKQSLSPTNFCDVIQLAMNHSDSSLFDFATEYFNNNVLDVLQTVEWQSFMKDNSTVANELFIKSYKNKK